MSKMQQTQSFSKQNISREGPQLSWMVVASKVKLKVRVTCTESPTYQPPAWLLTIIISWNQAKENACLIYLLLVRPAYQVEREVIVINRPITAYQPMKRAGSYC